VAAAGAADVANVISLMAAGIAANGGLEDVIITMSGHYHLIRQFSPAPKLQFLLLVVLDRTRANLAMALRELRDFDLSLAARPDAAVVPAGVNDAPRSDFDARRLGADLDAVVGAQVGAAGGGGACLLSDDTGRHRQPCRDALPECPGSERCSPGPTQSRDERPLEDTTASSSAIGSRRISDRCITTWEAALRGLYAAGIGGGAQSGQPVGGPSGPRTQRTR